MWEFITETIKIFAILTLLVVIAFTVYAKGWDSREKFFLEEMNTYGNVRINEKVYIIKEVISGDK